MRAAFEKCMADNSYFRRSETKAERHYSLFKTGIDMAGGVMHGAAPATDDVPLLSVCVEGGPGSIDTVQKAVSVCVCVCVCVCARARARVDAGFFKFCW